jgi:hypothetical protein
MPMIASRSTAPLNLTSPWLISMMTMFATACWTLAREHRIRCPWPEMCTMRLPPSRTLPETVLVPARI